MNKDLKILKKELFHYREKAEQYRAAFNLQKNEFKKARKALADIAAGLVSGECDERWSSSTKTQYSAALELTKINEITEPQGLFHFIKH